MKISIGAIIVGTEGKISNTLLCIKIKIIVMVGIQNFSPIPVLVVIDIIII